jgi:transketolase
MDKTQTTQELACKIRIHSLQKANRARTSHIGSCLSCADILAVLYGEVMRYKPDNPKWEGRDRFILSKGHAGSALYATLAECGFFPIEELDTHCQSGSRLLGHASHLVPGVEAGTGSLGHGLSIGCGMALATKQKVFVLLSDGDLNEGSTWEAIMFAGQHKLHNLTAIVDMNGFQCTGKTSRIMDLKAVSKKVEQFGWRTRDVNGHNHHLLRSALTDCPKWDRRPSLVVAHTVKGKGVSWMEGKVEWHFKSPDDEELKKALEELR